MMTISLRNLLSVKSGHRRFLQMAVAIAGLVPCYAGLIGVLYGPSMHVSSMIWPISIDSHFRYLSGLLLGIAIGFWSTIPHIENQTSRFQTLALIVALGGLSRLYALLTVGLPEEGMIFGLGMELGVTPLLALWQWRLSCRTAINVPTSSD